MDQKYIKYILKYKTEIEDVKEIEKKYQIQFKRDLL